MRRAGFGAHHEAAEQLPRPGHLHRTQRGLRGGSKAGVDPQQLVDILSAGLYESKLLHIMEATLHGDFAAMKFKLDNARKDVRYFNRLAGEHDVSTGVGSGVWEDLNAAHNAGFGDRFVPSLVEAAQAINGIQIKAGH